MCKLMEFQIFIQIPPTCGNYGVFQTTFWPQHVARLPYQDCQTKISTSSFHSSITSCPSNSSTAWWSSIKAISTWDTMTMMSIYDALIYHLNISPAASWPPTWIHPGSLSRFQSPTPCILINVNWMDLITVTLEDLTLSQLQSSIHGVK